MQVDHHDLLCEFPDLADAITVLKADNPYFARSLAQYEGLTGRVEGLEVRDMPVGDFALEEMKKQRVRLKDELYHFLLAYRAGQLHA